MERFMTTSKKYTEKKKKTKKAESQLNKIVIFNSPRLFN